MLSGIPSGRAGFRTRSKSLNRSRTCFFSAGLTTYIPLPLLNDLLANTSLHRRRFLQFPHLYFDISRTASPLIYWCSAKEEQGRPTVQENTRPSNTPFRSNRPRSSIQDGLRSQRTELQNVLRLAPAGPFVRPEGRLCWGESHRA